MKKYRVTEKHELLNEGIIIEEVHNGTDELNDYVSDKWAHLFSMSEIKSWMASCWIEEIEEPEFTKRDLTGFADFCLGTRIKNIDSAYETWIDIRNES